MEEDPADSERERYFAANAALGFFQSWLETDLEEDDSEKYACLFDYIASWLTSGGTSDCSGDLHIYLTTVALIIDWWNSERLGDVYESRNGTQIIPARVRRIVDWNRPSRQILDASYFLFWKARQAT